LAVDQPLLEVARREPAKAARFLEVVLFSGSLVGIVLPMPCGAFFLSERYTACGSCSRPLHIWVVVHCMLHFLQSPLRLLLLWQLRQHSHSSVHAAERGSDLEGKVRWLTSSRAWKVSTALSTAAYAWFVVGVVWLLNVDYCQPCPELYRLAFGVMVVAILKPILTMAAFRWLFGDMGGDAEQDDSPNAPPKGACEELIANLPQEQYRYEQLLPEGHASCAVCLCDFEGGEVLRRLPCGHRFHSSCVDKWLRRNKVCPLCIHDVALPPPRAPPSVASASWRGGEEGGVPGSAWLGRGLRLLSMRKAA